MEHTQINPKDFSPVLSLSRAFAKAANDLLGLSVTDFRVLACIASFGGRSNADIAASLDLSRSAVSMSIGKLRQSRLVSCKSTDDKGVTVTPIGRRAFDAGRDAMTKALVEDAPILNQDEIETLNYYMSMIADRLGAPVLSASGIDTIMLYIEANARAKQLLKRSCAPYNMTPNEFVTMCAIASLGGEAHPKDLSRLARLARPVIAKCCSALSENGYVEVSSDEGDGRGKSVTTTSLGSRTLHAAYDDFWSEFYNRVRFFTVEEIRFFRAIYERR